MSCPECSGPLTNNAISCPRCGYRQKKSDNSFIIFPVAMIVVMIAFTFLYYKFLRLKKNNFHLKYYDRNFCDFCITFSLTNLLKLSMPNRICSGVT